MDAVGTSTGCGTAVGSSFSLPLIPAGSNSPSPVTNTVTGCPTFAGLDEEFTDPSAFSTAPATGAAEGRAGESGVKIPGALLATWTVIALEDCPRYCTSTKVLVLPAMS